MPTTQDPSDQVRFLVSCIGHTTNGRPDFAAVAEELGIVSKAAAQKRYERMLKANGVSGNNKPKTPESGGVSTPEGTPVKRKAQAATPRTPTSAKKNKTAKAVKKEERVDDKKGVKKEEKAGSESELSDVPSDV